MCLSLVRMLVSVLLRRSLPVSALRNRTSFSTMLHTRGCANASIRSGMSSTSMLDEPQDSAKALDVLRRQLAAVTRIKSDRRHLVEEYVDTFVRSVDSLSTEEILRILCRLDEAYSVRKMSRIREKLREVALSLTSHGASSFSLSMFMQYAELCRGMWVEASPEFIEAMVGRIKNAWASSSVKDDPEQMIQLASYIIKLDRLLITKSVSLEDHIATCFHNEVLTKLSLPDIVILLQRPVLDDSTLKANVRAAFQEALTTRPVEEILDHISGTPDIQREILSACASRILAIPERIPAEVQKLVFHCAKQSRSWKPEGFSDEIYNELIIQSLDAFVSGTVKAVSQVDLALSESVIAGMTKSILSSREELENIDNLSQLLEGLCNLGSGYVQPPDLIGFLMESVDAFLQTGKSHPGLWKLALWWHLTEPLVPHNTVIGAALRQEFPDSIRTLADHPANDFLQPIAPSRSSKRTTDAVGTMLDDQKIQFVAYPRIRNSPIRAHFLVKLEDANPVYVFVTSGGRVVPVSKGSNLVPHVIMSVARMNECSIAFIEYDEVQSSIDSGNPIDLHGIIRENMLEPS